MDDTSFHRHYPKLNGAYLGAGVDGAGVGLGVGGVVGLLGTAVRGGRLLLLPLVLAVLATLPRTTHQYTYVHTYESITRYLPWQRTVRRGAVQQGQGIELFHRGSDNYTHRE